MDKKSYNQWYSSLEIGDKVVFPSMGRWGGETIVKLSRKTPSGMFGLSNGRMTNNDGSIRGNNHFYIHPVTEKVKASILRRKRLAQLKEVKFESFYDEELEKILNCLSDISLARQTQTK